MAKKSPSPKPKSEPELPSWITHETIPNIKEYEQAVKDFKAGKFKKKK